jgi:flavin reductase (DIM6/NTAB) family NADH-FMN oxidoreductase RutF
MTKVKLGPQTLLYPMPAALIGAQVAGKANFLTVAWCAIAAHQPPSVAAAINRSRYTLEGITSNRTFSVNIPSTDLVKQVDYCGLYSGRRRDKSNVFTIFYGTLKTAPMVEDCPLNLECAVTNTMDVGSHVLVVGKIVETYLREDCLREGNADPEKIDPLIYVPGATEYRSLGQLVAPAFDVGKESS